jgi:hypothetical protein
MARIHYRSLSGQQDSSSGSLDAKLTPYHEQLLAEASRLIEEGRKDRDQLKFGLALIISRTASEVYVEWISDKPAREMYNQLSEDNEFTRQSFWPTFQELNRVRNEITHGRRMATEDEARRFLDSVRGLIAYLEQRHR